MRFVIVLMFFLCVGVMVWYGFEVSVLFSEQKKLVKAKDDIAKLVLMTRQVYAERAPQTGEGIWKDIGRAGPILDPWLSPYKLEVANALNERQFFWRSAGPDRQFKTGDDLVQTFEFDFERPETNPHPTKEAT